MNDGKTAQKLLGFLVILIGGARLIAAPPEPVQRPVKLLGFGEEVDQEFAKLTDMGVTPFLTYYGVGLPGIYILGGYYSNFKFPELNGPKIQHNAYGFYAMVQQMLWRSLTDPFTNFSVWGGLTFSPQEDISLARSATLPSANAQTSMSAYSIRN
jgi:hypothetical protein